MSITAQNIQDNITAYEDINTEVLTQIYNPLCNMALWRRQLSPLLMKESDDLLLSGKELRIVESVTPDNVIDILQKELRDIEKADLIIEDISQLVDMFCCLFEQKKVGLRLTTLEHAMCPRFHVVKVPCRLITTYSGIGTHWLGNQCVDRSKLGAGNLGLSDDCSGIYTVHEDIQQLNCGDVALLKGENWAGNEGAGLVHRSPALDKDNNRLLLTIDFL